MFRWELPEMRKRIKNGSAGGLSVQGVAFLKLALDTGEHRPQAGLRQ